MTVAARRFLAGVPRRALLALVRAYRLLVSPALGASCRFEPSCSAYAIGALEVHGAAAGTYLTLRRLVRCGPWCAGGHDPVPDDPPLPRLFGRGEDAPRPAASVASPVSSTVSTRP